MLKQKRSKYFFGLVTLILFGFNTFAQIDSTLQSSNLKVGLVLSGGGAKAMAHLGLLRIMDEEGLQPDYIAGTSMGAVLGAMYAMGYSATEIQLKMYQIHWADVMTNDRPRRSLSFLDKQTEDRYALSFPISKGKILLPDGINYGHHILNELDRLSVGFHDVTDLSQLQIPFICIATNLETGEGVVLDKGYLPDVLRATSSFPTLFSPHEIDNKVLVDGGLVSNLPFFLLDGKGMDVLIGSDVQTILYTREDLNSVLRIMEQLSSFVNAENYRSDTAKADFLVRTEVPGAGISSFELMDSIIRQGYRAAEKYRPRIKELARLKGLSAATSKPMQTSSDTILIGKIVLPKSDLSSHNYLKSKLGIEEGSRVSLEDIKRGIDRIWGSQLFRTVDYSLLPIDSNSYSLNLRLDELNYLTHIRLGIHYDDDFQTAVLLNYTHRNLLLKNSKLSLDAAVGVNPRFWASYTFDREFIPTVRLSFRSHRFKSKIYVNQDLADEKVYLDFSGEFAVESAIYNRFLLSAGLQLENIDINNTRSSGLSAESNNNYLNYFGTLKLDLLDKAIFPTTGVLFNGSYRVITKPETYTLDLELSSVLDLRYRQAIPLKRNHTLEVKGVLMNTLGPDLDYAYNQFLGGLGENYINYMVPFVGYRFQELVGRNTIIAGMDYNWQFLRNHYLIGKANFATIEATFDKLFNSDVLLDGYGLSYAYLSPLGPLQLTVMGSTNHANIYTYVNLGFWF